MNNRYLVALISMFIIAACSELKTVDKQQILDVKTLEAFDNIEQSYREVRTLLSFENGETVDNCQAYFEKISKANIEETTNNHLVKSEYLICDNLMLISKSTGLTQKSETSDLAQQLLTKLDLRSFPSSLNRAAGENSNTLASLFPQDVSANENVASLETEDWIMTLEVIAIAELNNNKTADWIVNLSDEAKEGTYRSYQTIIIYDVENLPSFKAYSYPE